MLSDLSRSALKAWITLLDLYTIIHNASRSAFNYRSRFQIYLQSLTMLLDLCTII